MVFPQKTIKKRLVVLYPNNKRELIKNSRQEIKNIMDEFKKIQNERKNIYNTEELNNKNDEFFDVLVKLDNKNKTFIKLFALSLYCSYYHKYKHKIINKNELKFPINECFKPNNFIIIDVDNSSFEILHRMTHFFNTDSQNIDAFATVELLQDLNSLNVNFIRV